MQNGARGQQHRSRQKITRSRKAVNEVRHGPRAAAGLGAWYATGWDIKNVFMMHILVYITEISKIIFIKVGHGIKIVCLSLYHTFDTS